MNAKNLLAALGGVAVIAGGYWVFQLVRGGEPANQPTTLQPLASSPVPATAQPASQDTASAGAVVKSKLKDPSEGIMSASLLIKAQERLKDLGHYTGEIDGQWSRALSTGIKKYQMEKGLRVSGFLDVSTRAALDI